jgi:cytochrome P450
MAEESEGMGGAERAPFPVAAPPDCSGAPPGPRFPRHLLGALWLLFEQQVVEHCQKRYGDVFSLRAWPLGLLVVVSDPTEVKRLFTADPNTVTAGGGNAVAMPLAGRNSILLLDGDRHLRQRKLMLPAFHGERLGVYRDRIIEITDEAIDGWLLCSEFPIHTEMQSITLKVILDAIFGVEGAERRARLEQLVPRLANSPALLWPPLQRDFGRWSPWRRFLALREEVDLLLYEEIERKRRDPRLEERDDVLSMLVQARDENDEAMSNEELRDQLMTLLLAGHETSATALAWAVDGLLRNRAVLERLQDELATEDDGYLDCVIKESLRSRVVFPYAIRQLQAPFEIGGYSVPAGAFVGTSTRLIHSRPDLYPDPDAFRPERFEGRGVETYSWVPFGGGTRRCLGAAFATFEMKTVLRRVVERCDLLAANPKPERSKQRFVIHVPSRGGRVVLQQRRPAARSTRQAAE